MTTHSRQTARNVVYAPWPAELDADSVQNVIHARKSDTYKVHSVETIDVPRRRLVRVDASYTAVGADTRDLRLRVASALGVAADLVVAPAPAKTKVLV